MGGSLISDALRIQPSHPRQRRFDCPAFLRARGNRPDKSPANNPNRYGRALDRRFQNPATSRLFRPFRFQKACLVPQETIRRRECIPTRNGLFQSRREPVLVLQEAFLVKFRRFSFVGDNGDYCRKFVHAHLPNMQIGNYSFRAILKRLANLMVQIALVNWKK